VSICSKVFGPCKLLGWSDRAPCGLEVLFIEFLDEPNCFFCRVLADESAPIEQRKAAAQALRPYYHPMLAQAGPYLYRFLDRRK
jgi:hypothetical protein